MTKVLTIDVSFAYTVRLTWLTLLVILSNLVRYGFLYRNVARLRSLEVISSAA